MGSYLSTQELQPEDFFTPVAAAPAPSKNLLPRGPGREGKAGAGAVIGTC